MKRIMYAWPMVAIVLTACQPKQAEQHEEIMRVEVQTMNKACSVISRTYIGKSEDADVVSLSMSTAGTIREVCVRNGEQVRAGQVLIRLDETKSKSMLATATAKFLQAQDGYDRVKMVYDEGGISEVKMMEISTQLREASEAVTTLQSRLQDCTLRAPMAGEVSSLNLYAGQNVLPDMELLKLHNRNGKTVEYTVPEQDIVHIRIGDTVSVRIPALENTTLPFKGKGRGEGLWLATVTERNLSPNPMAHSYTVKCRIKGNTDDILPGMNCKIYSQKDMVEGYMIPSRCVQMVGNDLCVWVAQNGVAKRIRVESSSYGREGVLVSRGLKQGDQVITNGYQKLYEGMKIDCYEKEE